MKLSRGQNKNAGLALTDFAGRQAFTTIFGDLVTGRKMDDVSFQFQYNNSTNDLNIQTPTGTGEQSNADSKMKVSSGASVGDQTVFSKDSIRYRPGHEAYAHFTARFVGAEVGVEHFAGIGNAMDRVCFGTKDGVFGAWFQEGGNAAVFTPQSDFNTDKLDGTGDTGFEIDITKMNIYYPVYGWLGDAPLIWAIYGGYELGWIIAHVQDQVNTIEEPHLQNPSLPMVFQTTRASGSGEAFLETSSCRAGAIAGGFEDNASTRRFGTFILNIDATQATTGDATHLVSIKSKDTFQGKTNHVKVKVDFINSINNVNKDVVFEAYPTAALIALNPSFDPGYVDIDADNSVMQEGKSQDAFAINLETDGIDPLDIGIVKQNDLRVNPDVKGFVMYAGNEISFVIVDPAIGTGEVSIQIDWDELF